MHSQQGPLGDMIRDSPYSLETIVFRTRTDPDDPKSAKVSLGYLSNIMNGKTERMPDQAHLDDIAKGIDMPRELVTLAAIAQFLPQEDVALRALMSRLLAAHLEIHEAQRDTPETAPNSERSDIIADALDAIDAAHEQVKERRRLNAA